VGEGTPPPAARFSTGDPLLVERAFGKGRVVTTAFALDASDGNFPALSCFVPFVHEIVYHAAGVDAGAVSVAADARRVFWLSPEVARGGETETGYPEEPPAPAEITVEGPDGVRHKGRVENSDGAFTFHVPGARTPGIYRVHLPMVLTDPMVSLLDRDGLLPFAVRSTVEESRLVPLTRRQRQRIDNRLGAVRLASSEEVLAAIKGGVPGQEIWRVLALIGFALVLAETVLARWIARQRRGSDARTVNFSAQTGEVTSHQASMWEKLRPE